MCLIVFDWQPQAATRLRLAANRDEFHARPADALHRWPDSDLTGGRDLVGGGTWLAATPTRVAALTNVREGRSSPPAAGPSRGELVRRALEVDDLATWLDTLAAGGAKAYAGFNLLVMSEMQLWTLHHSRQDTRLQLVPPGLHGLSNASLDTPWPKVVQARDALRRALTTPDWRVGMRSAMADTRQAPPAELPHTGVGRDLERVLSAAFIVGQDYGTRATTLVAVSATATTLEEQRFAANGIPAGDLTRLTTPPTG
ncbi:NRDE family protein [Salinicola lusitanus]|uniref:NRDE family protein n=1 Tax=Salinicola lusitanus TaxID=1949085 RepID=A0ABZ3CMV5_9GAMM